MASGKFNTSFDVGAAQSKPTNKTPIAEQQTKIQNSIEASLPNKTRTESTLTGKDTATTSAVATKSKKEENKVVKKRRRFKAKKLVLNVSQTKYNIVRYVAKNQFKMRLSGAPYMADYQNPHDEWDLLWTDGTVQVDKLYRMKPYQRINHFPGMYALARKNHLARNL